MKYLSLTLAVLLAPLSAAHAEELADQVEKLEIEPGVFEIEALATVVGSNPTDNGELIASLMLEYGLSDNFQIGLEVSGEREAGEAFRVGAIGPQMKWAVLDPSEAPIGLGLQTGLSVDLDSGDVGSETYLIAEMHRGRIGVAGNLVFETEPGDWSDHSLNYGARVDWRASNRIDIGLEAGGGLSGEAKGLHWLGPVVTLGLAEEGPKLEFSAFAPLNSRTPNLQLRAGLFWEM